MPFVFMAIHGLFMDIHVKKFFVFVHAPRVKTENTQNYRPRH